MWVQVPPSVFAGRVIQYSENASARREWKWLIKTSSIGSSGSRRFYEMSPGSLGCILRSRPREVAGVYSGRLPVTPLQNGGQSRERLGY